MPVGCMRWVPFFWDHLWLIIGLTKLEGTQSPFRDQFLAQVA